MADTVKAIYDLKLDIRQTTDLSLDGVTNPEVARETASAATLDANSAVPVTTSWWDDADLVAGTLTLDLTALTRANLPNVDMTGLKVQILKFKADSANTAGIVVADHGTTGYLIFGDASGQVTVLPGSEILMVFNDQLADVSGSVKQLLVTSTDTEATYSIEIVAG